MSNGYCAVLGFFWKTIPQYAGQCETQPLVPRNWGEV
jgi:hypothetical protein